MHFYRNVFTVFTSLSLGGRRIWRKGNRIGIGIGILDQATDRASVTATRFLRLEFFIFYFYFFWIRCDVML